MLENFGLDGWKTRFDSYIESAQNNLLYVAVGFGALVILAGGFYWYRHASIQKEQAAFTILADCLSHYEQAAQGKAQWADVATMSHAGYEKFSSTQIAPYILAIEVDALLAQEKHTEAVEKLDLMVLKMDTRSPLYSVYKLKQVLVKLDIPELQEAAVKDLQQLAAARDNNFTDAAQYYLGLYYQNAGDQQKALEVWKPLVAINDTVTDAIARSPWATMAQSKINGLA